MNKECNNLSKALNEQLGELIGEQVTVSYRQRRVKNSGGELTVVGKDFIILNQRHIIPLSNILTIYQD